MINLIETNEAFVEVVGVEVLSSCINQIHGDPNGKEKSFELNLSLKERR